MRLFRRLLLGPGDSQAENEACVGQREESCACSRNVHSLLSACERARGCAVGVGRKLDEDSRHKGCLWEALSLQEWILLREAHVDAWKSRHERRQTVLTEILRMTDASEIH